MNLWTFFTEFFRLINADVDPLRPRGHGFRDRHRHAAGADRDHGGRAPDRPDFPVRARSGHPDPGRHLRGGDLRREPVGHSPEYSRHPGQCRQLPGRLPPGQAGPRRLRHRPGRRGFLHRHLFRPDLPGDHLAAPREHRLEVRLLGVFRPGGLRGDHLRQPDRPQGSPEGLGGRPIRVAPLPDRPRGVPGLSPLTPWVRCR